MKTIKVGNHLPKEGVGINPIGVAITPDGSDAYVTNEVSNTVSVIKTSTNTVVKTVHVAIDPTDVAITPNGSEAYRNHLWLREREHHQDLY